MKILSLTLLFFFTIQLPISGSNIVHDNLYKGEMSIKNPATLSSFSYDAKKNAPNEKADSFSFYSSLFPEKWDGGDDMFVFAGNDTTICLSTDSIEVFGYAENYHFISWVSTGDGFFYNATRLKTAYVPGPSDIESGKAILYLIGISAPPDYVRMVDSIIITIVPVPKCFAGLDAPICAGDTYDLQGEAGNCPEIFWSTSGDGSFDNIYSLNATYTPGDTDLAIGSSHLTLTALANAPCVLPETNTILLSYFNSPVADAGQDTLICVGEYLQLEALAEWYSQIYWTTSGDGTFSNPEISDPVYFPGDHDEENGRAGLSITLDPIWPCNVFATDSLELTLQVSPWVLVGNDQTVCENDEVSCLGWAENYAEIHWLPVGGNGVFDNANILTPVYTLGEHEISNGILFIMLNAAPLSPCLLSFNDYFKVEIIKEPTVVAGEDVTICEQDSGLLVAEASDYSGLLWETGGDGTFSDDEILSPVYFPGTQDVENKNINLFITAFPNSSCNTEVTDTLTLLIQPMATVEAGEDITLCSVVPLAGFAENYSDVLWVSSGNGTFSDPGNLETNYYAGNQDLENRTVSLTLFANPLNPCNETVFDVIDITLDSPELISSNVQDKNLAAGETLTFSFLAQSNSEGSYQWFFNNTVLENCTFPELLVENVQPINAGTYYCLYSNDCFQISSDTAMVSVFAQTFQTLQFEGGWNAVSSFIYPVNNDMAVILNPIIEDLVILYNSEGVYWPGQDLFNFLDWTPNTGYIVKTTESINLTIIGLKKYPEDPILLSPGWSILPVNENCSLNVAEFFSAYPEVLMIKEVGGYKVYWPEMGINTLENINPGKAYEIFNASENDISITFPGCGNQ